MAIFEYKHPLISHKLSILRNVETDTKLFRESLNEIASLMVYEATKDLKLKNITVKTPIQETITQVLDEPVTIVPILRAGLGMVDALLAHIPNAKVGHLGVYRNEETFEPVYYYAKMPSNVVESKVLIVDPMLATGGSIIYTIDYLKSLGVKNISILSIIAAPEGILAIKDKHDDVDLYIASIDKGLNENKYIYPGLGDAGDRIFGTK
ncbi:uracil phosphoribosyltransferase [Streptobacillus moniliformis]|uniref:Uracil phosphoribosyltransferase n=1 Tax=Streptobacillus moniliformis (strain ATCC 14647 / DSM 12112 / NCTC 10651 / 9901) TaxID=519441 RepID=D1AXH9_STRM9|nr:uracil phosphoribosyltransferase [Streptobacillus moniliformis]ACZ01005.1 uracil phosphoribosyltransferase [Streptobacillus moniliformis DSM 12112]AVL42622.1 uracil phosphoribosyltransferase [Streptobacillus moniliformis]QXW65789.1 uracil phosphoribosyltransferase [Streptobacillus moniliformis]SQA13856.1 Uracil phosphoribosyltransferase [Streptobacillus moniliformis]SQA14926.1 Uracil phosphoribosyltransferase [Streptobacillus moniliformis]